ncbi:unnamed protein product [Prorocentrum cordatum]|uniref:Peptidase C1A papain C-terminal domain-containing protein n=1 Tax=Prorocentrum cordatum TaxID=2364126 RepID=A0ABN9RGA0_9DINO|nr:unnamed protein product [Polarella glacialis]
MNPYMACSSDSEYGFCPFWTWDCSALNVARTCSTFPEYGGTCVGLGWYPNATINEYGYVSGPNDMMSEIYHRGPISCTVDATPLDYYTSGIITQKGLSLNHIVSVTGWGYDESVRAELLVAAKLVGRGLGGDGLRAGGFRRPGHRG